jgi:ABC-type multidrug transport system fused ATPase/permease subunit
MRSYLDLCKPDLPLIALGTTAGVVAAYYGAYVTDLTSHAMSHALQAFPVDMLLYSLATIVMMSARGMAFTLAQKRFENRLATRVYNCIFEQDHAYYHKTPTAGIIDQATNDVRMVASNIALCINVFTRSTVSTLVTTYLMYHISVELTLVVLVLIPASFAISHAHSKIHLVLMKGHDELCQSLSKHIQDTLSHALLLRTYLAQDACMERHACLRRRAARYDIHEMILYGANVFIMQNMPTLTLIAILVAASRLHTATPDLVAFVFHQQTLQASIRSIVDFAYESTRCVEPMRRVTRILAAAATASQVPGGAGAGGGGGGAKEDGAIEFQQVSFKYGDDEGSVLRDLTFTVPPGAKVAFIGRSGSGKSTIAKLLVGMLKPTSGRIRGMGVDAFGYVSQEVVLLHESIAFNISFGKYSQPEIEAAARAANAHDFIAALPQGYDTVLTGTEMGSLSGGEKQRISIARALLRRPHVLVFDEATSALDPESEELVQASIERIANASDCTVIIIAHRPSAYAFVDTVYRLEKKSPGLVVVRGGAEAEAEDQERAPGDTRLVHRRRR